MHSELDEVDIWGYGMERMMVWKMEHRPYEPNLMGLCVQASFRATLYEPNLIGLCAQGILVIIKI
jgi:hypothetical protein